MLFVNDEIFYFVQETHNVLSRVGNVLTSALLRERELVNPPLLPIRKMRVAYQHILYSCT